VLGVEPELLELELLELLELLPHAAINKTPSAMAGTASRLLHDFIRHSFPEERRQHMRSAMTAPKRLTAPQQS
jgi:hypothetical protein